MSDDQNPAGSSAGDETLRDDLRDFDAPLPDEVRPEPEAPDEPEQAAGEEQPETSAQDGADAPPQEDDRSRSARRREQRKRQIAEEKEKALAAEKQAEAASKKLEAIKAAASSDTPPREEDFEDFQEFQIAKVIHAERRRLSGEQEAAATEEQKQAQAAHDAAVKAQWNARVEEAKAEFADFEAVAYRPDMQVSPAMVEVIRSSEKGPALAYHLGSNLPEAARIAALPPTQAAYELGRIEAALSAPKPRTKTKAPPPVRPVRTSGAALEKSPAEMSNEEYRRWRRGK